MPVFLEQVVPHRQVRIHLGRKHRELAIPIGFFGDVRVERESAYDEHVKANALHRLLGRVLHQSRANGAVLGADGDGNATHVAVRSRERPLRLAPRACPRLKRIELQSLALLCVLHAGRAQVLQDHAREVLLLMALLLVNLGWR